MQLYDFGAAPLVQSQAAQNNYKVAQKLESWITRMFTRYEQPYKGYECLFFVF